jgi:2,3-bisphosphoglycerate-dependent phosphoglycerate mutase
MQDPTRIFLMRHGQTAWNAEMRVQGQLDIPLDEIGLWQADQLGRALRDEGIQVLYCSDLQRARQTMAPLAAATALPVQTDMALRERGFGSFEGSTYAEIETRWPEEARRWRLREPDFQPGGGESLLTFYARSVQALLKLAARHPGQTLAVVAHGGVLDCVHRAAARITLDAPRTWQLANATINRLLWTPEGLSIVGWNDAGHLELAAPAPDAEPS